MTPHEFKSIRISLGLSLSEMAGALGLSEANGADYVRKMENANYPVPVSGPAGRCARLMLALVDEGWPIEGVVDLMNMETTP
jgi:transcriptional regulator with XRE-family HTH domain